MKKNCIDNGPTWDLDDIKSNYIDNINEIKNSYLTENNGSKLIHEITQKEIKENEFTGTNIYDNSNEINNSGK